MTGRKCTRKVKVSYVTNLAGQLTFFSFMVSRKTEAHTSSVFQVIMIDLRHRSIVSINQTPHTLFPSTLLLLLRLGEKGNFWELILNLSQN